jgi:hypothetical protein
VNRRRLALAYLAAAIIGGAWGIHAPSCIPDAPCNVLAEDYDHPSPGDLDTSQLDYRHGTWYDPSGRPLGYSIEEDARIYDRPGCLPTYTPTNEGN